MLIIFLLALFLRAGRCTDDLIFETKTVDVGDDVKLTCTRPSSDHGAYLFWIRLVSGNLPEFLGGTFSFDYDIFNKTSRITAKQEPGTFLLHISEAELSDTGLYYCIKVDVLYMKFLKGTFLRIKVPGPEPDITTIIQVPPSDPVHPGDSVTLQCSVLSDSEKKTCPGDHSVYWFRAGSNKSHPSLIYAHGNSGDQCEKSPEAQSTQKCVYNFFKTVSSSDAGTHYCAVATCGEILFGNGTKVDIEDSELNMWDLQKANTVLFVLSATLALSLIGVAFLIYILKKKTCDCCKAADAATVSGYQQSQQREEDSLTYSAATFTKRKAGKAERRNVKTEEGETVYTGVRTFAID
ncbi:signal-regulatory protein beta-2-like [Trachinotus anak]|uniref:signal-regulatory protein beta-2-like n=1 Tax=Trachinotus anak TaxID=443729 RepID=UPI0039F20B59